MTTAVDDAKLVEAARAGDRAAFAALLERHAQLLRALCRRMVGDAASAQDAAQETALQALLSLDRLRRGDRFGPWLGGIALNICRRWLREQRDDWSWEALAGGRRMPEPADPAPDPTSWLEKQDLAARVRRAVDDLPRGQRAAVLLVYLAGLTHSETAALLGVEAGAVKARLHKARARLRRELWATWQEVTVTTEATQRPIPVRVADVRRRSVGDGKPDQYAVILEELDGPRRLTIWVGRFEANGIVCKLEGIAAPRPQTFAFARNILDAAGGRLAEVRVSRLTDDVFYAVAVIEGPKGRVDVDARPSDALNLALLVGAPILVEPDVQRAAEAGREAASAKGEPYDDMHAEGTAGLGQIADELRGDLARYLASPPER
jgi:RNA polymerase sigma-70 factor (ECF subfamily)